MPKPHKLGLTPAEVRASRKRLKDWLRELKSQTKEVNRRLRALDA